MIFLIPIISLWVSLVNGAIDDATFAVIGVGILTIWAFAYKD